MEEHKAKLVRTGSESNENIPEYSLFLSGWIQRRRQMALLHSVRFSHPEHHQHQDGHKLWTPRSLHVPCGLQTRLLQSHPQTGTTQAWIGTTRQA